VKSGIYAQPILRIRDGNANHGATADEVINAKTLKIRLDQQAFESANCPR